MLLPSMSLKQFEQRVLLEIWMDCQADMDMAVSLNDLRAPLNRYHGDIPPSWLRVAIKSLRGRDLIRDWHSNAVYQQDEDLVYLTEAGLQWAYDNHDSIEGYSEADLQQRHLTEVLERDYIEEPTVLLDASDHEVFVGEDERIIQLSAHRAKWDQFAEDLREIGEAIRTRNDWDSDDQREEGLRVQRELVAGATLLEGTTVDRQKLRGMLESGLKWAGKSFADGTVKLLAAAAWTFFAAWILKG